MTERELNQGIARLIKLDKQVMAEQIDSAELKKEFIRLYYADTTFDSMNKKSVLILFRINLKHRFIALHSFGMQIDLNQL